MIEIERKFLVRPGILDLKGGKEISQWYVMRGDGRSLRVRRYEGGYVMTVKVGKGIERKEIERKLSDAEALSLIDSALEAPVEKTRHSIKSGKHVWSVDVFKGPNEGLWLAEVELQAKDEYFERPAWIGKEVSGDACFQNANLARNPISRWRSDFIALLNGA
ncbi:CYTH domain-containing protein [Kordiimonas lipolytica]|uniref:CYTH domain-containing protein n=1 Tax=Kordiimonas lipolytica TaxID=1662421 RepID=A0ABV8U861_9PROT|nr:CYTH domain-containing protein [Kordiimonas lipolytica]